MCHLTPIPDVVIQQQDRFVHGVRTDLSVVACQIDREHLEEKRDEQRGKGRATVGQI